MKKSYADKLRDPRWQKKRLEILERDGFKCRDCHSETKELHIHHSVYIPNIDPWECPDDLIKALCRDCHPKRQKIEVAIQVAIARLISNEPLDLIEAVAWRLAKLAIEDERMAHHATAIS